ncbi:hypothetical protein K438DRAFT_1875906 [Mycena galopus ATCC 62051]|nr:hypothetical protein K438DRAFT_1875906 [Mycena galopus ATCC 62051]
MVCFPSFLCIHPHLISLARPSHASSLRRARSTPVSSAVPPDRAVPHYHFVCPPHFVFPYFDLCLSPAALYGGTSSNRKMGSC